MAEEGTDQHLLRIKPFNGTEFDTWESNLKLILEQHSVLDVINGSPPNPNTDAAKAAEFTQNDIKARFIITQAIADHMQVFIKDQKTAKGMLECLQRDFGSETIGKLETQTIHIWTDDETKRLLNFYHQLIPELQAGRIATKDKMMAMIEKKMGGFVTAAQCYNRIKSLQRSFRLHKTGKGGRSFRSKYADIMEAIENGNHDNSSLWFDLNGEPESMDVECDPEHANASKQIYESTTLIPRTWTEEETMRLLDLYNQLKPELVVGSISSQEKVMEIIAQEMGGHLSPLQCLNKFKNVRAAYKNYKKDPVGKKFKYADAMDAIEGGDPDHSVADEANDESHEIVIVGHPGDISSEGDTNDGEAEAALTFMTGDSVDTQDHESEDDGNTEQRNYMAWSHTTTVKLLSLVENFASQVGSPQVRSRARMWVLVARRMGKTVTPDQCSSRWKTLEKSYKKAVAQGRGHRHPYSTQMKNVHKRLNDALLPIGSKLVLPKKPKRSSDDITFLLDSFDNSMDGDTTGGQDEIPPSPRVTDVYSLLPNETDEPEGDSMWCHENTLKLIDLYKQLKGHVGTFKMRTHKKMWQVIAEHMGGNLNAGKCENRWRVLERKYRKHLSISNTLGLKGRSIKAFEYFPQMDAILNWSSDNPVNPPVDINSEFSGVHLSASTVSAPPVDILATSSFETTQRNVSEDAEEDSDVNKEKIPHKLRILERMRRDKKAYYTQMLSIHRERLDIEHQRLEELKRKNRILERSISKKT